MRNFIAGIRNAAGGVIRRIRGGAPRAASRSGGRTAGS
jgi:hypothetical protein